MRADEMLFNVVGGAFAKRGFVECAAAIARHQNERLVGAEVLRGADDSRARCRPGALIDR